MKHTKIALVLVCALMLTMLVACGGGEKENIYSLTIEGVVMQGNQPVKPYLDKLGSDYQYSESISCAYDGMDKIYAYKDFSLYTYPDGDKDYVLEVEVLGGDYAPDKGIKIGSSREDVIKAYGEKYFEDGALLYYNKTNDAVDTVAPMLYFVMDGNTVISFGITGEGSFE